MANNINETYVELIELYATSKTDLTRLYASIFLYQLKNEKCWKEHIESLSSKVGIAYKDIPELKMKVSFLLGIEKKDNKVALLYMAVSLLKRIKNRGINYDSKDIETFLELFKELKK
jgi:hypothetical protein